MKILLLGAGGLLGRYLAREFSDHELTALTHAEADITHVDMGDEPAQSATDIRFTLSVRDRIHMAAVLRSLRRTPSVVRAQRQKPKG